MAAAEAAEPVSAEAVLRELGLFELRFLFLLQVLAKRGRKIPRRPDNRYAGLRDIHSLQELLDEDEEEELLDAYATPSKDSRKRGGSTPENPRPKRTLSARSPYALFSPSSFSPSATPSQKYASRGGRGEVVASFGAAQGPSWSGGGGRGCSLKLFAPPEENLTKSYKFMFQKALDVREVLSWRIEELGEVLRKHHGLEDFASVRLPAQEPVTVLGQIGCDSNGKLNAKSVVLEGDREHSSGGQVPVDLSELQEYSLFPGQIVAMEGTNSTGRQLVASKIYEGVLLPFYTPPELAQDTEQQMVLVACGPYTTSDSIAYDPLSDLVDVIGRDKPDVCILFGPFLDAKHEQVENCQLLGSFADVFKLCLKTIIEGTRSAGSQLVFVPSLRDVHHDYVYPQPPFACAELPKEDKPRVHFVSDPCTLDVHGTVFGLTSTDLLFHMGAEEISSSSGISDRFTRILKHVLTQRSYYPLYPPAEEMNVDYETFYSHAALPVTPDVLVAPSELRYFVKDVLGCVCVNPGRLTKGQVGGTYGRLYVRRCGGGDDAEGRRRSPCVAAQVVRI
ncbi:DNA polymerase alpha subunit B [Apteryx rowi]|uniref:DNA polymerase alpha subunit B n=1 Tax=Apteryx rowi TaxID=308060 RepID=UPI000E1C73AF|nr:DNA polymerase alpha subunit B [Apteryx rowi]